MPKKTKKETMQDTDASLSLHDLNQIEQEEKKI